MPQNTLAVPAPIPAIASPQPDESSCASVVFLVEGLCRATATWEPWGVWDGKGVPLNPADTLEAARSLKGELDDYRLSEVTGWTDSRVVEVTTLRRVVR